MLEIRKCRFALVVCDRQGLIGRELFAIDGVKLPSNASKAKSGTRADYQRQAEKMEKAAKQMLARHRETDMTPVDERQAQREACMLERFKRKRNNSKTGWRLTRKIARGQRGVYANPTSLTMNRPKWLRARASSRDTQV